MRTFHLCAFDIETGPLPEKEIERIAPPFNENKVKVGNLGLEKQLEKIRFARENHLGKIISKAALNAEYGRLLAVGFREGRVTSASDSSSKFDALFIEEETPEGESALLEKVWARLEAARDRRCILAGHNSNSFDLPFLIRRSFVLGVRPLPEIMPMRRWFPDFCIDTMDAWRMGDYDPEKRISLDRLAKAMGIPGKEGDGARFAELFREDRPAAESYLKADLDATFRVAARMLPTLRPF